MGPTGLEKDFCPRIHPSRPSKCCCNLLFLRSPGGNPSDWFAKATSKCQKHPCITLRDLNIDKEPSSCLRPWRSQTTAESHHARLPGNHFATAGLSASLDDYHCWKHGPTDQFAETPVYHKSNRVSARELPKSCSCAKTSRSICQLQQSFPRGKHWPEHHGIIRSALNPKSSLEIIQLWMFFSPMLMAPLPFKCHTSGRKPLE